MASDNEASCIADPNFAVICAFLQKFGTLCGLSTVDFIDLQKMIENTQEVPQPLLDLHLKLLRRIKKTVPIERWERILARVCHSYNNQDGWEIERFGYKKSRISCKLRTLKTLLEMQFDYHTKFKSEVNKLTAEELRSQPLGRDKLGHAYWCQIDEDCQIRVYKEDPDEETWMLIAQDRDGLLSLISQLKENDSIMTGIEPVLNEDSNSLEIEKPILDTGQADSADELTEDTVQGVRIEEVEKESKKEEGESNARENTEVDEVVKEEDNPPPVRRTIGLRLKPMSELLNSPSAAQYEAEEEAKKKRFSEETVEDPKPMKTRKLTLMNSKPLKIMNKKHVEVSSEEDDEDMDDGDDEDDDEDMEDSDEVGEEIEEPVMYVKGRGRGRDNNDGNLREESPIVGEEISEDVFYVFGEGLGADCKTGNENNEAKSEQNDKATSSSPAKSSVKLGMIIDSRTDKTAENATKSLIKKNRWDVKAKDEVETAEKPKVSMFFFGPNTNATAGISFFGSTKETEVIDSNNSVKDQEEIPSDNVNNDASEKNHTTNQCDEEKKLESAINTEDLSKGVYNQINSNADEEQLEKDNNLVEAKPIEESNSISAPTCDISKINPDEEIVQNLSLKNVNYNITNTLDLSKKELSSEEENLNKRDIVTNDISDVSDKLNSNENTKENTIDSNTVITEMEIEEVDDKDVSNIRDKSGENMDIENIDVNDTKSMDAEPKIASSCTEDLLINEEISDEHKSPSDNLPTDLSTNRSENNTKNVQEDYKELDLSKKDDSNEDTVEETIQNESDNTTINEENQVEEDVKITEEANVSSTEKSDNVSAEIQHNDPSKTSESSSKPIPEVIESPTDILSSDKLDAIESCIVPISETALNNIEPPAIIITSDNLNETTEPLCVEKSIAPLTNTEDMVAVVATTEKSIVPLTNKEDMAASVATTEKSIAPLTNTEDMAASMATTLDVVDKSDSVKKVSSPLQSIESVESIDADCHASSIDRDSEMDAAEDPFDNVGTVADDPLGIAEEEREDEVDEAEEEEVEEEEEDDDDNDEEGEINPEDVEDEEVNGEEDDEDGVEEEEVEDEEEDDEEDETESVPIKGGKVIAATKSNDKKTTLTSFSMDYNDSSDSLNLPPMLKDKLKKHQMSREQLKNQSADDSDDEVDEEEEVEEEEDGDADEEDDEEEEEDSDEEEPPKPILKGKTEILKGARARIKGVIPPPPPVVKPPPPPPPVQVKKSTTADLRKERRKKKTEIEILREEIETKSAPISGVRQSRRIAQIKIREEAEKRKLEDLTLAQIKFESKRMFEHSEKLKKAKASTDDEYVADVEELKKKKKKRKHKNPKFDEHNPWKSSSESSSSQEEEQDEEAEDSDHDIRQRELKSDHEFSPESDLEDGAEVKPMKRARTVRKDDKTDEEDELDDTFCEKCGKFDHPEFILLCDGCDHGWHCSCLRPALLEIPEGDWFCPPCQHAKLLKNLENQLVDLDKRRSKQQMEVRRKERLAYVGISLNNVLPSTEDANVKRGGSSSSDSTDSSDSDEPIYQLRQRRQAHSYRFNEYDDLINSAIQDEEDPDAEEPSVGNQGRGKDIATIVNAGKEQRENEDAGKPTGKKVVKRKKKRKLNSLVVSSGEDGTSDEDFRGSSTDEDEDDLEFNEPLSSNSSDDSAFGRRRGKRGAGGGTRRSTRARWTRMDRDFINDDTDEELPLQPKRKRTRQWSDDSDEDEESELSDRSWSRKKRGSGKRSAFASKATKSKKMKTTGSDSDEPVQKKKRKIKFGGLNDTDEEDEEEQRKIKMETARRTRGNKITYVDALGSDSEEEMRRRRAGIIEESEEEYVAEDDDGLEDEDGNEIEKDTDDSDANAPVKVQTKPIMKKGKGKGGITRIKRAQGIEDELFPPLKPDDATEESIPPDKPKEDAAVDTTEREAVDPMQEINRNIECMDEKLMMEDPDYATKQLQMVAAQLERKKKEDAALCAAEATAASEDMAKHRRGRKPKVIPYMSPTEQVQPQVKDDVLENSNSPGTPVPVLSDLSTPTDGSPSKKRRGRGKGRKTLEKEAAAAAALAAAATALGKEDLGVPPKVDEVPKPRTASPNIDPAAMATAKLAIATPPQPFSQTEPAPSVITRMLQAPQTSPGPGTPPGSSSPAAPIPAGVPYGPGPPPQPPHKYYGPGPPPPHVDGRAPPPPLRGAPHLPPLGLPPHGLVGPYGPPPMGGMNHRPYHTGPPPPGGALPPHMMRTPTAAHSPPMPPSAMYHHHHTVDASPSGGSAIQPIGAGSPGRIPPPAVPPDRHSPSALRHTPPPPTAALIAPPGGGGPRYPPHAALQPPPRHHHMIPQHMQPPQHGLHGIPPRGGPIPPSVYPPGPPPPGAYYNTYPSPQPSGIPPEDYHHHHITPHHPYGPLLPPPTPTSALPPIVPESPIVSAPPSVGVLPESAPIVGGLKSAHVVTDEVVVGHEDMQGVQQDSSGEFGGLVSYFSSQREDDLDG